MNAVRARQARLVVAPLWRASAWRLVPLSALLVLAVTAVLRLAGVDAHPEAVSFAASLLMAGAAGYAMDDASTPLVGASPAPLAFRLGIRVLGVAVLVGACWTVLLAYVSPAPVARPTLVLAVLVAVALLSAVRFGGVSSGPVVVAFVAGASALPDRWTLLATGTAADLRLAALLVAASTALVLALRDPASRVLRQSSGRSDPGPAPTQQCSPAAPLPRDDLQSSGRSGGAGRGAAQTSASGARGGGSPTGG